MLADEKTFSSKVNIIHQTFTFLIFSVKYHASHTYIHTLNIAKLNVLATLAEQQSNFKSSRGRERGRSNGAGTGSFYNNVNGEDDSDEDNNKDGDDDTDGEENPFSSGTDDGKEEGAKSEFEFDQGAKHIKCLC